MGKKMQAYKLKCVVGGAPLRCDACGCATTTPIGCQGPLRLPWRVVLSTTTHSILGIQY
jgi:hypothetical protein